MACDRFTKGPGEAAVRCGKKDRCGNPWNNFEFCAFHPRPKPLLSSSTMTRHSAFTAVCLVLLTGVGPSLRAQLATPAPAPIIGARMPALSPDGKRIALVYRGDIWVAPVEGGPATALTQNVETDAYPIFSPDGKWVAFASKRNGGWDIYVVPAEGGAPQQITWSAGAEIPYGWSPDGKNLLFSAKRDSANYGLFTVDVKTLRTQKLCEDHATMNFPTYSPDGKSVVYGRYGFHWTRPRDRKSVV